MGWRVWRELYARHYGTAYTSADEDGRHMGRLAKHAHKLALEHAEAAPCEAGVESPTEQLLRHWLERYLADSGSRGFLREQAHSLRYVGRDLPRYGTPWAPPPGNRRPDKRLMNGRHGQGDDGIDPVVFEGGY